MPQKLKRNASKRKLKRNASKKDLKIKKIKDKSKKANNKKKDARSLRKTASSKRLINKILSGIIIDPKPIPKPITKPIIYGHVFSNNCGYCSMMQNDWDKLTDQINDVELKDIGYDHETHINEFNKKYKTTLQNNGFPTIFKLPHKGSNIEYYTGERTCPSMKSWIYG